MSDTNEKREDDAKEDSRREPQDDERQSPDRKDDRGRDRHSEEGGHDRRSRSRDRDSRRDEQRRGDGRSDQRGEGMSLLVRNLDYDISPDDLRDEFGKFGEVRDVYIPLDYYSRRPKGFAFVEFLNKQDAEDALRDMDGRDLRGRSLKIVVAQQRRKTPGEMRKDRGGYRRRDYGRDRHRGRYRSRSRSRDRRNRRSRSYSRSRSRDRYRRRSPSRSYSR
mmetsp:Transcript_12594/g.14695  ORF Transcript_12594/g.14695 Transcript_12594/m.14695 type:complete len:220 (-) Transcript_12594:926-1585(-)